MKKVMSVLNGFKSDRRGVTALEYGLIAAVVAVVLIIGASQMGNAINNTFVHVAGNLTAASPSK